MIDARITNILMVDDDKDDIYATKRRLADSGIPHNFASETQPDNLFQKLDEMFQSMEGEFNLVILLDVNMPGINGFEVLRNLKKNDHFKHIPVFMLCHSDDVIDMAGSFSNGANGYLIKPLVPKDLLAAINDLNTPTTQWFASA